MELERTTSMTAMGRAAALHIAFWQYDRWYRRAWFVWPQLMAILLVGWLLVGPDAIVSMGNWAKPVDCTSPLTPGCASTRQSVYRWGDQEIARPTIANQVTGSVDPAVGRNSSAD